MKENFEINAPGIWSLNGPVSLLWGELSGKYPNKSEPKPLNES